MHPIAAVGCLVAERGKGRGNESRQTCFVCSIKRFDDRGFCLVGGTNRDLACASAPDGFCFAGSCLLAVSVTSPFLLRATRDFLHSPTGDDGKRLILQNIFITCGTLRAIVLLDQQPVVTFFSMPAMHAHEVPTPVQLLAVELECEVTLGQAFMRIGFGLPMAAIPDHHRPAAIFPLRYRAFEFVIGDRVILDLNGQPLFAWHEAWSSRHSPAFHHSIKFEPQIVVESPGGMLLYDESVAAFSDHLAFWLGGDAKSALGPIRL